MQPVASNAFYQRQVPDPTLPATNLPSAQVAQFGTQQLGGLTSGTQVAAPGVSPVSAPSVAAPIGSLSGTQQQLATTTQHIKNNEQNAQQNVLSMYAARNAQKAAGGFGGGGFGGTGNPGGEFANDSALDNADFAAGRAPRGLVKFGGGFLQQNAARNLAQLNAAYHAATGGNLSLTEGWRSMSTQQKLYALYRAGKGVAVSAPGSSIHNSGNAADLGGISPQGFRWLTQNASKYGWKWAGNGISGRREPWLWQFVG
jgi:hypothetical protein